VQAVALGIAGILGRLGCVRKKAGGFFESDQLLGQLPRRKVGKRPTSRQLRALLADRLVESLDPLTDEDVCASWSAEALQRLEDVRSGKVKTIPADEALARVRSLLK